MALASCVTWCLTSQPWFPSLLEGQGNSTAEMVEGEQVWSGLGSVRQLVPLSPRQADLHWAEMAAQG